MDTSTLLPPRARAAIYVATAMLGVVFATAEANTDLPWGWRAAFGAWTVGANLLAASNVTNTPAAPPDPDVNDGWLHDLAEGTPRHSVLDDEEG